VPSLLPRFGFRAVPDLSSGLSGPGRLMRGHPLGPLEHLAVLERTGDPGRVVASSMTHSDARCLRKRRFLILIY
jgi:hypothetical protein